MVDDAPAPMTKVGRLAESRLEQKEDYGRDVSRRDLGRRRFSSAQAALPFEVPETQDIPLSNPDHHAMAFPS